MSEFRVALPMHMPMPIQNSLNLLKGIYKFKPPNKSWFLWHIWPWHCLYVNHLWLANNTFSWKDQQCNNGLRSNYVLNLHKILERIYLSNILIFGGILNNMKQWLQNGTWYWSKIWFPNITEYYIDLINLTKPYLI